MTERIMYCIQSLRKRYEGRLVLDIPALEIPKGQVFALVGPSGSGKSTLLRLLNFLEYPSQGSILFDGIPFSMGSEIPLAQRRRVTMVFQRPLLLESSVWDNVAFGLRLRGIRDARDQIQSALEAVGLEKFAGQRARKLSVGEAQRVALARAMVIQPDVLLMDEPTANLDPYNVSMIEQIALLMNRTHGTTLVLVTHNVFQARRLGQQVALLMEGKIIESSATEIFFNSPKDPRTSAFVRGDMVY